MPKKKTFILQGKMIFEAEDIYDAFMKMSKHFKSLANGGEGIFLFPGTDILIEPLKDKNKKIKEEKKKWKL